MAMYKIHKKGIDSRFLWNKNFAQLEKSLGFGNALNIGLAETCARYMNKYVPMKDGFLSQNYETGSDEDGGYVKYVEPYAHKQYNGTDFNFSKEMHPLATHHWDEAMMIDKKVQLTASINDKRKKFSK